MNNCFGRKNPILRGVCKDANENFLLHLYIFEVIFIWERTYLLEILSTTIQIHNLGEWKNMQKFFYEKSLSRNTNSLQCKLSKRTWNRKDLHFDMSALIHATFLMQVRVSRLENFSGLEKEFDECFWLFAVNMTHCWYHWCVFKH